ncbi:MAG TPA: hypothetical protein VNJ06_15400 [Gemmatimonadales bacterium]|nr:hypothetical protein [Gemmatimonadales bacterium]
MRSRITVDTRGGIGLAGFALALADNSLKISLTGHRFSSLSAASAPALGGAAKKRATA